MAKKKGTPGRKELPPELRRDSRKEVQFTESELAAICEEADRRHIPSSQLIREWALDALARLGRR